MTSLGSAATTGIFINYRGEDSQLAAALIDRELTTQFGNDQVFLDSRSIPAGTDFVDELLGRARTCRVLLVVIGPRWLTLTDRAGQRRIDDPQDWIRREIVEAFSQGRRVIPVLLDGVTLPAEPELPEDIAGLSRRQYVPLRRRYTAVDLAFLVERITETDSELAKARRPPAQPAPTTVTAPWTSAPSPSPSPSLPGAEKLLQRAKGAVAGGENLVVHVQCQTRTVYGVMRLDFEGWALESAGQARMLHYYAKDSPQADVVYTRQPDGSMITESLDPINRTVATFGTPGGPSVPVLTSPIGDPRDLLTGINYTTDGRPSDLGGRQAYRLSGPEGSQLQVWLDAQTYRVVRVQTGLHDITYQWLPANEENLALLKHEVPADFTRR